MNASFPSQQVTQRSALSFAVYDDFSMLEAEWRAFEKNGLASPYQHFDWIAAYKISHEKNGAIIAVVLRNPTGSPELILPLELHRERLFHIATLCGGKHTNFALPLRSSHFSQRYSQDELTAALQQAGKALGIDAYSFTNAPALWNSASNPLVLNNAHRSPSDACYLRLEGDAETTFKRSMSKDTRKKLRAKERKLTELGTVQHHLVAPMECDPALSIFFEQKRKRFADLHLANPFSDPAVQDFLRRACQQGTIELHSLTLNDRVIAVFGGTGDGQRFSGMFNSFDTSEEIARHSPGDLLLLKVIDHYCRKGFSVFDLGVGEARYKSSICDETELLYDSILPVSFKGYAYAVGCRRYLDLKRRIKHTPWAMNLRARLPSGLLSIF